MIPGATNPQSWNRYSYVGNNPIGYADPTGHWRIGDEDEGKRGCTNKSYCLGGKPLDRCKGCDLHERHQSLREKLNVNERNADGYFPSWTGEKNIDPGDWQDLLSDIRDDVHATWGMFLPIEATWYDTPFYNDRGKLSGRGCLDEKCYARSELNYVAQGEVWAAVGVSNSAGHKIVKFWKESKCLWTCERNDLQEEYDMFDVGYRHYQELYPPHPTAPNDIVPGIMAPIPPEGPDI